MTNSLIAAEDIQEGDAVYVKDGKLYKVKQDPNDMKRVMDLFFKPLDVSRKQ